VLCSVPGQFGFTVIGGFLGGFGGGGDVTVACWCVVVVT
jgi:hypothetical protein